MSLTIYTDKRDIPENVSLVSINDLFFDSETNLKNDKITKTILKAIDKAEYNSDLTFIGRTKEMGALNKNMLSSGTKTLLNIISYPDKCFDVCECGSNALGLLPLISDGIVYWETPAIAYSGEEMCDIIYNGKHYNNFYNFLEQVGC